MSMKPKELGVPQMPLSGHEKMSLLMEYRKGPSRVRVIGDRIWMFFENAKTLQIDTRSWSVCRLVMDKHRDERSVIAEKAGCIEAAKTAYEAGEGRVKYPSRKDQLHLALADFRARIASSTSSTSK